MLNVPRRVTYAMAARTEQSQSFTVHGGVEGALTPSLSGGEWKKQSVGANDMISPACMFNRRDKGWMPPGWWGHRGDSLPVGEDGELAPGHQHRKTRNRNQEFGRKPICCIVCWLLQALLLRPVPWEFTRGNRPISVRALWLKLGTSERSLQWWDLMWTLVN